jgi:hypothetical protein
LKSQNRARELGKILDAYPPLSLLLDIDYFQSDPKSAAAEFDEFVQSAKRRTQEASEAIGRYVFGEKDAG